MLDDLRSGLRQIRRNPGFAAAAILTLALGVGATSAVFTLADPMLFRPLPYPEAHRVVQLGASGPKVFGLHVADFLRVEASHRGLEAVASFGTSFSGAVADLSEPVLGYQVTRGFFDVLRVRPMVGRAFLPDEFAVDGAGDRAIITFGLWRSAFGGRSDVLDQPLEVRGVSPRRFRIVGVLPPEFVLPEHVNRAPGFFIPYAPNPATQGAVNRYAGPIARLGPGVSIEAAAAELQGLMRSVEREYPAFVQGRTARIRPLQEALFGHVRTPLLMLLGATACVLLLACANLAHLFMARLHARHREFGVRLAIGAGTWRLARLILIEAAVFAAAGGAAALVLGQWTFDLIMARTPEFAHVYRLLPARLDWRVAGFAAVLVAVALGIVGAIPAFRASRMDIRSSLQSGAAGTVARRGLRGDAGLIFVQSTVAIILLVTGALITRSFIKLAYQPLGFEPEHVRALSVEIPPAVDRGSDPVRALQVRREISERLRDRLALPVTLTESMPGLTISTGITALAADGEPRWITAHPAGGDVFEVFGMRLVRGRLFDEREALSRAPVAVVDQTAADLLWPGEEAIGKAVRERDSTVLHVVGIVQTLRTNLRNRDEQKGTAFIPLRRTSRAPAIVYRAGEGDVPLQTIRSIVQEVAPDARVTVWPFRPFERTLGEPRFLAALLGALGLLTIALTVVGVFGVVNHEVARRTREVGIRISLGADAGHIRLMILRRALVPAALGVACGAGVSLWWTRTLRTLLFGLQPNDPATFVTAAALVLTVVAAATLRPAWRASRVEPVVALRLE